MSISTRIHDTIEKWTAEWKDRLQGWMVSWLKLGTYQFFEDLEPSTIEYMKEYLAAIRSSPDIPSYLAGMIDKAQETGQIERVIFGYMASIIGIIPQLFGLGAPLGRRWSYDQELVVHSYRLDLVTLIDLVRRNPNLWTQYWSDLKDQGWSDERLAGAQELVKAIPPLADMVRFADFSAFDPEVIAKWREFYDAPSWLAEPFRLVGIENTGDRDWANKYWFSHFRQPGRYELGDMYRRGLLGKPLIGDVETGAASGLGEAEDAIKLAYRTQGYSAYWQDRLLELVREIPTRVDVRRWWDMRTIDEAELRSIYQRQGYFGKDLDNYVLWTKVYTDFPVLMARWTNGWITEDEVRQHLTGLGMPPDRVEDMIQEKVKAQGPARVEEGRTFTKSEIYKGLKQEVINQAEAVELIMDLGYTRAEAEYLIDINVEALTGSPESFADFKRLTTEYRRAVGKEEVPMPDEVQQAAADVVRLDSELRLLQADLKRFNDGVIDVEPLPEDIIEQRTALEAKVANAEIQLNYAKGRYETELAKWRATG